MIYVNQNGDVDLAAIVLMLRPFFRRVRYHRQLFFFLGEQAKIHLTLGIRLMSVLLKSHWGRHLPKGNTETVTWMS